MISSQGVSELAGRCVCVCVAGGKLELPGLAPDLLSESLWEVQGPGSGRSYW